MISINVFIVNYFQFVKPDVTCALPNVLDIFVKKT